MRETAGRESEQFMKVKNSLDRILVEEGGKQIERHMRGQGVLSHYIEAKRWWRGPWPLRCQLLSCQISQQDPGNLKRQSSRLGATLNTSQNCKS